MRTSLSENWETAPGAGMKRQYPGRTPRLHSIRHIDKKWRNNRIESDHAAMKRLLGYRQSFRSLRSAKETLSGIETIRTIKHGHIHNKQPGVRGEIQFISALFEAA